MKKLYFLLLVLMSLIWTGTTASAQEAYATLSKDNTVLTFYYDSNKESRGGMSVGPFEYSYPESVNSGWFAQCWNITTVVFDDSFAACNSITSTGYWFYGCGNLTTITGINNLKTDNVTDMSFMFYNCERLTSLDVSHFNTANVTNMHSMFHHCSSLTSLDVSSFNTANVTVMQDMFSSCTSLTSLDLSNFNTTNVTDMQEMFFKCRALTSLDVSSFNTANVTKMGSMFGQCKALTSLNVSNFNTANVTDMNEMFRDTAIPSLDLSNFNTANVANMSDMFYNCSILKTIYVDENNWSTASVINSSRMFSACTALVGGNGTAYDANHTDAEYARIDKEGQPGYFTQKSNGTGEAEPYAALSSDNSVLTFYYDNQKEARGGMSVGPFESSSSWYDQRGSITSVVFDDSFAACTSITSTARWFSGCQNLSSITGMEKLNTANVTDMFSMFHRCSNLTSLDVSSFNTANVTVMQDMFSSCTALTSLDLSNFNTANVKDMQEMFNNCRALTALDLSSFNTANVTKMGSMFEQCKALVSLNVSSFNTANVTDMNEMFRDTALPSLDLSNFNTTNVTNMGQMFDGCSALTSIDLSSFNAANVSDLHRMFYNCSSLTTIYCNDAWSCDKSTNMFDGCTALVGGKGTKYDANHVDAAYAHIDGGTANPGYFTETNRTINLKPIEGETTVSTDGLSEADLTDNVVNDVYYNVGEQGYDAAENSIVISEATNMAQIADKQPGSKDVKENFNGMILKVAKGKGLITVDVKTSGNAQLVVQVGNGTPMLASKTEKGDVVFRYDVEEDTYVYIYAIIGSSAAKGYSLNAADTDGSVRIYSITVSPGATGIRSIGASEKNDAVIYDLQGRRVDNPAKGIYIIGGRKVSVK